MWWGCNNVSFCVGLSKPHVSILDLIFLLFKLSYEFRKGSLTDENLGFYDSVYLLVEAQGLIPDKSEWTGDCTTGRSQSPVEISTEDSVPLSENPLVFEFFDQPPKSDSLLNNGHSVTFRIEAIRVINYPQVDCNFVTNITDR